MGRPRDQKILQWEYEFKVTNNLRKIILEYNPFEGWRLFVQIEFGSVIQEIQIKIEALPFPGEIKMRSYM